jgi:diadenosine tetraphosphatase ApaH/serine/threonine PP2A family protein phosphatase
VNVGSVGQPRDGDWRACYALLEGDTVLFRRVEYDVEATVRKVRGCGGLGPRLGERLRQAR